MAKKEKHIAFGYKTKDGKGWMNFRPQVSEEELAANYVEITEQEWNEHCASLHHEPTQEELAKREIKRQIAQLKGQLKETDWVVVKIAEETDPEIIASLREKYAEIITGRKAAREQINELEESL